MLNVQDLNVHYGAIHAVHDVSLTVEEGEIVSLIGSNGAGKSTILQTITGMTRATSGSVRFGDWDLLRTGGHRIVSLGLAHVPEGRRIFSNLTVEENLDMGAFIRNDKDGIKEAVEGVFTHFPRLKERRGQYAGTLSGGEQQMLAIGRALMSEPKMLVLDEPSMGLAPLLVNSIFEIIEELNARGVTILLVEQNAKRALMVSDRAYVLETGKIVLEGNSADLLDHEDVKRAYLGA